MIRIFVLALGTFALGTDVFVIAGILPDIARDLNISVSAAGQQVTVFAIVYAVASPVLATLVSNFSQKRVLLYSLIGFILANVLCAMAPEYWTLMAARIMTAAFAALYTPSAYAAAASVAPPEKRGKALSMVLAGLTLSIVFGVPFGTWVGQTFGWRSTFLIVGLLGFVAFLGLASFLPEIPSPPVFSLKEKFKIINNSQLLTALSVTTLALAGLSTVYAYIAPLLNFTAQL